MHPLEYIEENQTKTKKKECFPRYFFQLSLPTLSKGWAYVCVGEITREKKLFLFPFISVCRIAFFSSCFLDGEVFNWSTPHPRPIELSFERSKVTSNKDVVLIDSLGRKMSWMKVWGGKGQRMSCHCVRWTYFTYFIYQSNILYICFSFLVFPIWYSWNSNSERKLNPQLLLRGSRILLQIKQNWFSSFALFPSLSSTVFCWWWILCFLFFFWKNFVFTWTI